MLSLLKGLFTAKSPGFDARLADDFDMGMRLAAMGDYPSAIAIWQDCLAHHPHCAPIYFCLGEAYRQTGQAEEAASAYQIYLTLDPADAMGADMTLYLMGLGDAPYAMPEAYIKRLFDQYAHRFDIVLGRLDYQAPEQMAQLVFKHKTYFNHALDLGCGTGLSAAPFKHAVGKIDGVDLSSEMLAEAAKKNIYAGLHQSEIGGFLSACTDKYELIIAADMLIYFGTLDTLFYQVAKVLDGLFAFSVQLADQNIILGTDHRFAHGVSYIDQCIKKADMEIVAREDIVLRQEQGEPVKGAIYLCASADHAV